MYRHILMYLMMTNFQSVWAGGSLLVPCQASDPAQHFSIDKNHMLRSLSTNTCLDGTCGSSNTTGCYPLPFTNCTNSRSQQWSWTSTGQLSNDGDQTACLDVRGGGAGPLVGLYRCDTVQSQRWSLNTTLNLIKNLSPESTVGPRCLSNPPPPPPPPKGPFVLDRKGLGPTFDGIGAISGGGATSRCLPDYPTEQQSQILDFLFKPNFGASLQMLKVEVGGDIITTDGSESTHMHNNHTVDLKAGYEWWLMKQAKARNPSIKLYGLPWAYPGWVGNDPQTGAHNATATPFDHPEQTVRYMMEWVRGAKTEYGLDINYLGIWNESPSNANYVKMLRRALDSGGFNATRIVAQDGGAQICAALMADPEYAKAVDVIGLHYPSDFSDLTTCHELKKPVWASEESSSYDDLNGAACWARVLHSHFTLSGITSSIMWNLLGAYYPGTSWYASSMFTANQPWSGWYGVRGPAGPVTDLPVVWATAHITQFTQIGWRYLNNGYGSGQLVHGGFFTTVVGDTDFSLHVVKISYDHAACTRPALPPSQKGVQPENVTFVLSSSMGDHPTLALWRSNFEMETPILFEQQPDIKVENGRFTLEVEVGDYFTVSTVRTAHRGSFSTPVPSSQPRVPLPILDDFNDTPLSQQPRLWAQMIGAWEVHPDPLNGTNQVLRQMAEQHSVTQWRGKFNAMPGTLVGMREWQDVSITATFRLPSADTAACVGTRTDWTFDVGVVLCVGGNGQWNLTYGNGGPVAVPFASGRLPKAPAPGQWNHLSLSTLQSSASGFYNGQAIFTNTTIRDIDTGFAALTVPGYFQVEFDDVRVVPIGPSWNPNPQPPPGCAPGSVGQQLFTRPCQTNGITAQDENFQLMPDWRLVHVGSGLCAAAESGSPNSIVTLQHCDPTSPLQLWKNDYSNIHHDNVPLTLEGPNVTLVGSLNGNVRTQPPHWVKTGDWSTWSFFDSTGQLRSQRTPRDPSVPTKCLSVCQ